MSRFAQVLSSFDDFPVHQTSQPIAHTASADLNHYDRYFFNGYTRDTRLYFAAAMGLYPNRHIADAAFSVVLDGGTVDARQINVHASRRAPDRPRRRQSGRPDHRRGARAAPRAAPRRRGTGTRAPRRPDVRSSFGTDRGASLPPPGRHAGDVRLHPTHPVRWLGGLGRGRRRTDRPEPGRDPRVTRPFVGYPPRRRTRPRPGRRSPTRSSSGSGRRSTSRRSRPTST